MSETTDNKFTITLKIAGIQFKLRIERQEEEIYRRAADELNKMYDKYIRAYPSMPRDNTLIALGLQFAVNNIKTRKQLNELVSSVNELSLDLEEFLKQE